DGRPGDCGRKAHTVVARQSDAGNVQPASARDGGHFTVSHEIPSAIAGDSERLDSGQLRQGKGPPALDVTGAAGVVLPDHASVVRKPGSHIAAGKHRFAEVVNV